MLSDRIRILLVDDEAAICRALSIALERADYSVRAVQSGDAALAVLNSEHIDVLLIDLRIPDMRGDVVFELAAAIQPQLRTQTLFMTGDMTERAHRLILSCRSPSIQKPFELKDLIAAVAAVIPTTKRKARGGKTA